VAHEPVLPQLSKLRGSLTQRPTFPANGTRVLSAAQAIAAKHK
jgi:hypothetical protein